jgi:tight adherence protein B
MVHAKHTYLVGKRERANIFLDGAAMLMIMIAAAIVSAIATWYLLHELTHTYERKRRDFQDETRRNLSEFFIFLDPAQLWTVNLAFCTGSMALLYGLTGTFWVAVFGLVALGAPGVLVSYLRRERLKRFDQQLPDFLMALAGAVRAGSGVQSALRHVTNQSPAPLGQEFAFMLRQQRLGLSLEQALTNLHERVPTEALGLVVSSLKIASQTGAGLASILDNIAATLRSRLYLLGRIRALTAQGRMQAWVMAGLPVLLACCLHYLDPASMQVLWRTPLGWVVMAVIASLELMGLFWIRHIVTIRV